MTQTTDPRFLCSVDDNTSILCEKHAKVFEQVALEAGVPHTIYELDEDDGPYHCHACDLVVAKDYARRVEEQNSAPRIILPD